MSSPLQLKLLKTIPMGQYSNMKLIRRYGSSVFATQGNSVAEINFESSYIDKSQLSHEPIIAKYLSLSDRQGIYVGDSISIKLLDYDTLKCSTHLRPFNLASTFTPQFHSDTHTLVFSKYHQNHKKYSISSFVPGHPEAHIHKLLDSEPSALLLSNHSTVSYLEHHSLKHLNIETSTVTSGSPCDSLLYDDYNYYEINDCKVKGFSLARGKELYEFKAGYDVRQVEEFGSSLLVGTRIGLEWLDVRMLEKPLQVVRMAAVAEFLFEPNLGLLFLNDGDLQIYTI